MDFDYQEAFKRNLGLVSAEQQQRLANTRVAVAGLGGVGGAQVYALVRLGIGRFTLADLDTFELSNFNRQLGANINTIGLSKAMVLREQILAINPTADVKIIDVGITPGTIASFLNEADIVLDALDFNCYKERFLLYKEARRCGRWILNVPPPGFGSSLLAFAPNGMTFGEYFDIDEDTPMERLPLSILYGITPSPFFFKYVDLSQLKTTAGRFPCVSPAFFLSGGITAAEVFNILIRGTPPKPVPTVYQFDALLHQYKKTHHIFGMRNPWHRLMKWIIQRKLNASAK